MWTKRLIRPVVNIFVSKFEIILEIIDTLLGPLHRAVRLHYGINQNRVNAVLFRLYLRRKNERGAKEKSDQKNHFLPPTNPVAHHKLHDTILFVSEDSVSPMKSG